MSAALAILDASALGPELVRADLDDFLKALIILVFFFGPALKAVLDKVSKATAKQRQVPPPGSQRPSAPASPRRPVSWEDLMRGKVPEAAPPREQEPVEARVPSAPVPQPEPLAGSVFAEVPAEEELELGGVEATSFETDLEAGLETLDGAWSPPLAAPEVEAIEPVLGPLYSGLDDTLVAVETSPEALAAVSRARTPRAPHWLRPDDWRRSIVLAEVLGPPLSVREQWSHPGPAASTR